MTLLDVRFPSPLFVTPLVLALAIPLAGTTLLSGCGPSSGSNADRDGGAAGGLAGGGGAGGGGAGGQGGQGEPGPHDAGLAVDAGGGATGGDAAADDAGDGGGAPPCTPGPLCARRVFTEFEARPRNFIAFGDQVAFTAKHPERGESIYVTDGTAAGTELVFDFDGAPGGSNAWTEARVWNDKLFFVIYRDNRNQVWVLDAAGDASLVAATGYESANGGMLAFSGGVVYNGEIDGMRGLVITDGTVAGTRLLAEGSIFVWQVIFEDTLFFTRDDYVGGVHIHRLYSSDGTEVVQVADIDNQFADAPVVWNGAFWFLQHLNGVRRLWSSDGTPEGTALAVQLPGNSGTTTLGWLSAAEEQMYFKYTDDDAGTEWWRTDGTPGGTYMIEDLWPGTESGPYYPGLLVRPWTVVGDEVFFGGKRESLGGMLLFRSDGTQDALMQIATDWNNFEYLSTVDDAVYGLADIEADGVAGNDRVVHIESASGAATEVGGDYSAPTNLVLANDKLWFGTFAGELWVIDRGR